MSMSKELYACSKCFTRHPFEELSQGQQLCKKCRGDFPVVKCTYCRSEFQQESKSKTSSICKRCETNVAQYGKPTSCQFCQLPAAFVGGKCLRCSSYYKRYGPPKTCDQCKQKSAFDRGDNSPKLMCWACSCSYKRALAKTKQQDPARHSSVFKEKKQRTAEEEKQEKERKKEKYMKSKMPKRPDVTKLENEGGGGNHLSLGGVSHSAGPPPNKVIKRERETTETDHMGEITQLKEKIAALEKQIRQKDHQLIAKDQEITQMKAKVFNEEKLIREKMKMMAKAHEDKVTDLQGKTRSLQSEISRMKKVQNKPEKRKADNLFKNDKKFSKNSKTGSRTASPISRSRSRSPKGSGEVTRSRSRSPFESATNSRSGSQSPSGVRDGSSERITRVKEDSSEGITRVKEDSSDGITRVKEDSPERITTTTLVTPSVMGEIETNKNGVVVNGLSSVKDDSEKTRNSPQTSDRSRSSSPITPEESVGGGGDTEEVMGDT